MQAKLKRNLAKIGLRLILGRLLRSKSDFDRLLGLAVQLQLRKISEDEFRRGLEAFYSRADLPKLMDEIDFEALKPELDRPKGYKKEIVRLREAQVKRLLPAKFDLWARRFRLLRHLEIRSDVLILRAGQQIPPHGHHRVVSGFMVLSGEVETRLYDRIREEEGGVVVRKVFDEILGPGGYTAGSEFHQNIHWLAGRSPTSYLFRMTVLEVPVETFGAPGRDSDRVYVDPTMPPDESGLIRARYINGAEAAALVMSDSSPEFVSTPITQHGGPL